MKSQPEAPASSSNLSENSTARLSTSVFGSVAKGVSVIPGQPIDVLKTRRHMAPMLSYPDIIRQIRQEPAPLWRALYAGSGIKISLMAVKGFYRADLMTTIPEKIKGQLSEEYVKQHPLAHIALSILPIVVIDAGVRVPLEAFGRLKMLGPITLKEIFQSVKKKPYAGFGPTALKDLIGWGIFLGVDETVTLKTEKTTIQHDNSHYWKPFVTAAITGFFQTAITNPLDIMTTGMQKDHLSASQALSRLKAGGVRGACVGALPRLYTKAMDALVGSATREWAKKVREEEHLKATNENRGSSLGK